MTHDTHVPGYAPVLCHVTTKQEIQRLGKALPDSGFTCERRVVQALLMLGLEQVRQPDQRQRLIALLPQLAAQDLQLIVKHSPSPQEAT
ncbi:MAG: hypothetical protein KF778_15740 [Rhodocyclaceae bacterium]|nr:hypothetical protein [Rhodocyclaceae bacterium]MBX3669854.1 hypothetical protein [Rhodocyclaceae bacterium]